MRRLELKSRLSVKRVFAASLTAGLFVWAMRALPEHLYQPEGDSGAIASEYIEAGEALVHHLPLQSFANEFLPMSSVLAAAIFSHSPPGTWRFWRILSGCADFFLILAVACLMGSLFQGLAAFALLMVLSNSWPYDQQGAAWHGQYGYPHSFLTLLVLIVAGFCVWYAKSPSPRRSLLLGLSIGATLLFRSTLVFFPILFVVCDWIFWRWKAPRGRWIPLAILCVVPYMFMVPWIAVNWTVHRRFIPLEDREANLIIVHGALGLGRTSSRENNQQVVDSGISGRSTPEVLAWAAGQVFRHPQQYAAGYWFRLRYAILLNPFLFLAAVLGLFRSRGRREVWSVGFIAAYYLFIHCFMGVEPRYFDPLCPLLALLGASGLGPGELEKGSERLPLAFLAGALGFSLILCLWTLHVIGVYAGADARGAAASAERLEAELRIYPHCPWLLSERGKARLAGGDIQGAIENFSKAAALSPDKYRDPQLAWAWAMKGDPGPLLAWEPLPQTRSIYRSKCINIDALILKAHLFMRMGSMPKVLQSLRAASKIQSEMASDMISSDGTLIARVDALLKGRPPSEKLAFYDELVKALPESSAARLKRCDVALELGNRGLALSFLAQAESLHPNQQEKRRIADLYHNLGNNIKALAILRPLAEQEPQNVELWLTIAGLANSVEPRAALEAVGRVERLNLNPEERRRVGDLYHDLGNNVKALAILRPLAEREPHNIELWLTVACLANSVEHHAALEAIGRVERLNPNTDQLRKLALCYQDLGDFAQAGRLFGRLVRDHPKIPMFRSDLGVVEALDGKIEEAIIDLREAVRLNPGFPAPYLTLGGLYVSLGRLEDALKVYESALKTSPTQSDAPVWNQIREEDGRIRARLRTPASVDSPHRKRA